MSALAPIRRTRLSQPNGDVQIDWSNPIVREINPRLVVYMAGGCAIDAVSGRPLTRVGTAHDKVVTKDGYGAFNPASLNDVAVSTTNAWDTGYKVSSADRFFLGRFLLNEAANTTGAFVTGSHDGTNRAYLTVGSSTNARGLIAGWGEQGANSSALVPTGTFDSGKIVTTGFTAEGSAASGVTKSLYYNGTLLEQQSGCSFGAKSTQNFLFGRRYNANGLIAQSISTTSLLVVIGGNPGSARAHAALHENPWQVFL